MLCSLPRPPQRSSQAAYNISSRFTVEDPGLVPGQMTIPANAPPSRFPYRAGIEAYWQNFRIPPDDANPPDPPKNTYISNTQYAPRAPVSEFWLSQRYISIEDEPMAALLQMYPDSSSRRAPRAANWCYFLDQRAFYLEDVPMMSGDIFFPDQSRAKSRATSDAYVITATFLIEAEYPLGTAFIQPSTVYERAGADAFKIVATFVVQDEPQVQRHSLPDSAKAKRRPAQQAFFIFATITYPTSVDVEPPKNTFTPHMARRQLRPGSSTYWVDARFLAIETEATTPNPRTLLPPMAPALRRPPPASFEVNNTPLITSLGEAPPVEIRVGGSVLPIIATARPRSNPSAYWVDIRVVLDEEPAVETRSGVQLPYRATSTPRAALSAFWVDQYPPINEEPAVEQRSSGTLYPQWAKATPRASSMAYWVDVRWPLEEDARLPFADTSIVTPAYAKRRAGQDAYAIQVWINQDEQFAPRLQLPDIARAKARPQSQAFWFDVLPQLPEPLNPPGSVLLPTQARSSPRASADVYFVATLELAEDLPGTMGRGYQDWTPRLAPRAGKSAYFVSAPPVIFESAVGLLSGGTWIETQRGIVWMETKRDVIWTAPANRG